MQLVYQRKFLNCKALDIDISKRKVKIAIAETESIDRDNDVFDPKAFDITIKEQGPTGANEIWHLLDHTGKSFSALSKFSEVYKDGKYIAGVSLYKDSFAWREVAWPLYESGDFTQHSVGFTTVDSAKSESGTHNIITQARLYEGSAVLWGANPNTPTLEVLKGFSDDEISNEELIMLRFDRAIKRVNEDKFFDGNKSLLLIELLQLQNSIKDLTSQKTTRPEHEHSTLPENKVVDTISKFINQLKTA